MSSDISQLNLTQYEQRLVTYMNKWEFNFITPSQMAKAGFYYTGTEDRVKCLFCSIEFGSWDRDDDPLEKHKQLSPRCPFFSQEDDQGYDECGLYNIPIVENDQEDTHLIEHSLDSVGVEQQIEDANTIEHSLDPVGLEQQIKDLKYKEFSTFDTRLQSFSNCEVYLKKMIVYLCEAGIFYTRNHQNYILRCFCCGQRFEEWEFEDDIWIKHAQWSPNCNYVLFIKGKDFVRMAFCVKNVPINNQEMTPSPNDEPVIHNNMKMDSSENLVEPKNHVLRAINGCTIILNSSYVTTKSISEGSDPLSKFSESLTWDSIVHEYHLRTFIGNWNIDFITPSQMAKAGLHYFDKEGLVKCTLCTTKFGCWRPGDDPLESHRRVSPDCSFFRREEGQGFDVCGGYRLAPAKDDSFKIKQFLDSIGVVHQIQSPKSKEYASFDTRLNSFKYCEINIKQDIHSLSEAGLFYCGNGKNDQVLCFYCDVILLNWRECDDPWTEHAIWSPRCSYVLLEKGKNFVDEAFNMMNNQVTNITYEEMSNAFNADVKRYFENLKITENNQIKTSLSKVNSPSSQQDPNSIPDSMLCIICMDKKLSIAFIPCGHVTCIQCAMKLDYCGVCRQAYSKAMKIYVYLGYQIKNNDLDHVPCSSSQCSDESFNTILCKVCCKKDMEAVFLPCRHVYACIKCATDMQNCPICLEAVCAIMQVYL